MIFALNDGCVGCYDALCELRGKVSVGGRDIVTGRARVPNTASSYLKSGLVTAFSFVPRTEKMSI